MAIMGAARVLRGFKRTLSVSASNPHPNIHLPPPKADPSPNLFISGLSKRTTSDGLRDAFEKFGRVVNARVVTDRNSGYSKGFGFVRYETTDEAARGIEGMDGKFLDGTDGSFLQNMLDPDHHLSPKTETNNLYGLPFS